MRRGELKLMENVIAFLVIIVIGMIALIYFSVAQGSSRSQENQQRNDLRAVSTARALYNMPELACTFSQTGRCIDLQKAKSFGSILANDQNAMRTYLPVLGHSSVSLQHLGCTGDCTVPIYDLLDSNDYRQIQVPVLVYDPVTDVRSFGWLEVRV